MISVFVRQLLVQLETPDDIRGRVSAVSSMFIGASNELGEFESGLAARAFGLVPSVLLGGIATLVVVIAYLKIFPELRRMDAVSASRASALPANCMGVQFPVNRAIIGRNTLKGRGALSNPAGALRPYRTRRL